MSETSHQNGRQGVPAPRLRVVKDPAGRPPPHDLDAEAAVLSAAMLVPESADAIADLLTPADFYSDANGRIWEAVVALRVKREPADVVSVASWLRARDRLAAVGGAAYLAQLVDATPSVAHAEAHARIVARLGRRRRLVAECQCIAAEGYGEVEDEDRWTDEAVRRIARVSQQARPSGGALMSDVVTRAMHDHNAEVNGAIRASAIPTGFATLDEKTCGGLHRQEVTLVTGITGRGKSAFAGCIAVNVAAAGAGVAYFMLEDTKEKLSMRMSCAQGRVDAKRFRSNQLEMFEHSRLIDAASWISKLPIVVDDDKSLTVADIRARTVRYADYIRQRWAIPLGLVVVDYLQLVNVDERENRAVALGKAAKELMHFAEEADVALLELSQLNDDGLIFESRSVLMHAMSHWDLERDVKRADNRGVREAETARVQVKKQRHGPMPETAALWFHPAYVLFSDEERP